MDMLRYFAKIKIKHHNNPNEFSLSLMQAIPPLQPQFYVGILHPFSPRKVCANLTQNHTYNLHTYTLQNIFFVVFVCSVLYITVKAVNCMPQPHMHTDTTLSFHLSNSTQLVPLLLQPLLHCCASTK